MSKLSRRAFLLSGASLGVAGVFGVPNVLGQTEPAAEGQLGAAPPMVSGTVQTIGDGFVDLRTSAGNQRVQTSVADRSEYLRVIGRDLELQDEVAILGQRNGDDFVASVITPLFRLTNVRFTPDSSGQQRIADRLYRLSPFRSRLAEWRDRRQPATNVVYAQSGSGERVVVDGPDV